MDGLLSLGKEDHSNGYLTLSTMHDYENLFELDVLSLDNTLNVDQYTFTEFQEQLQQIPKCLYQTWKPNHPNFYTNKKGSLVSLLNLIFEPQHDLVHDTVKEYVGKIEEQLLEGVVRKHMQP